MACFTIPLAEAIIVSASKAIVGKIHGSHETSAESAAKITSIRQKVGILEKMLYGGSFLLAVEHIYHGEVTFLPPFLTALKTPDEIPVMLHEMATSGVGMALLVTGVWGLGVGVFALIKKLSKKNAASEV